MWGWVDYVSYMVVVIKNNRSSGTYFDWLW